MPKNRQKISIENRKEVSKMDTYTLVLACIGASYVTIKVCNFLFWLDQPRKHHR